MDFAAAGKLGAQANAERFNRALREENDRLLAMIVALEREIQQHEARELRLSERIVALEHRLGRTVARK
jgi:hypothetical protein